jgi:hypothetical protein
MQSTNLAIIQPRNHRHRITNDICLMQAIYRPVVFPIIADSSHSLSLVVSRYVTYPFCQVEACMGQFRCCGYLHEGFRFLSFLTVHFKNASSSWLTALSLSLIAI